jgi:zinc finger protein 830
MNPPAVVGHGNDVRQLMKKSIAERTKKINSPFVRYNNMGQVVCTLCNVTIKAEAMWLVHCKGKTHAQNLSRYKQSPQAALSKHPTTSSNIDDLKQTKRSRDQNLSNSPLEATSTKKPKQLDSTLPVISHPNPSSAAGAEEESPRFFDEYNEDHDQGENHIPHEHTVMQSHTQATTEEGTANAQQGLPQGFFDDPRLDAKMRGACAPDIAKEDALNKEWEKFQATISEDQSEDKIEVEALLVDEAEDREQEQEQEKAHEHDQMEQVHHWREKRNELRTKTLHVAQLKTTLSAAHPTSTSTSTNVDVANLIYPDSFLDWRAKASELFS